MNTIFSALFGRGGRGLDRICIVTFENNLSFQEKVKLIDWIANRVDLLVLLVLFELKELDEVSDLFA